MMKFLLMSLICFSTSWATTLKLATLTPEGTNWAHTLQEMSKEVAEKTQRRVRMRFYYGGVQGDESVVVQKMRIGQLHGGVFTGRTLGDLHSDIRSIELPFNFLGDVEKASLALKTLAPIFNQKLQEKGLVNLGFYELGNVYLVSTKKVTSIEELKGIKVWTWEGDKMVEAMVKSLGLLPVPLPITDVHSSLSTGVIDSAYGPTLAILALQWQSKVKFLVDFPIAFSIGSFMVDQKVWSKISESDQKIVADIAQKYIQKANEMAKKDSKQGLQTLKELNIEFVKFSEKDLKDAEQIRINTINVIKGSILSDDIINQLNKLR